MNCCHLFVNIESSTRHPSTHIISTVTATTRMENTHGCKGNCTIIWNMKDRLCVNFVLHPLKSWQEARHYCQTECGGDLVVLDSSNKAHLLRSYLQHHSRSKYKKDTYQQRR